MAKVDGGVFRELGVTGLQRASGAVYEEFLPQLQGERGIRVLKEMAENDPIVGGILFAIDMFLRKVEWRVDPASPSPEDEANAQFLRECMDDMSHTWQELISEIMSMLQYGWAFHEVCYKRRLGPDSDGVDEDGEPLPSSRYNDGRIGWRKMPIRSQETLKDWDFDKEGGVRGMVQQSSPDFTERTIPIAKALLFRTTTRKNNPEGRSILRNAYRPWFFKKRIEEIEAVGVERDLVGLPKIGVPSELLSDNPTASDRALLESFKTLLKNVRRDEQEGVIFPLEYDEQNNPIYTFELVSSGGTRVFDTNGIIERYDKRIAMVVLADFILLGSEAVGSYALSVSKTGMFQAALSAWLDSIEAVLNRHAVPRLFALNGIKVDSLPIIKHGEIQEPTIEELSELVSVLTATGWKMPTEVLNSLMKIARLPQQVDETEGGGNLVDDIEEDENEAEGAAA